MMVMVIANNGLVSYPASEKDKFAAALAKYNGEIIWDGKNSYFIAEGFAFMYQGRF